MSGNTEEEKSESGKHLPLDLARTQIAAVKTVEGKGPVVMTGQHLRGMRVLTQAVSTGAAQTSVTAPTIITTNIFSPAVLKQGRFTAKSKRIYKYCSVCKTL